MSVSSSDKLARRALGVIHLENRILLHYPEQEEPSAARPTTDLAEARGLERPCLEPSEFE